jgi:magnesium-transporting ATPase (P-type)
MQIVESILTGESTAVEKNTKQITTKRLPLGDRQESQTAHIDIVLTCA